MLLQRIEAATPAGRDRAVDGLRAVAIAGVVLGHWLVTAMITVTAAALLASGDMSGGPVPGLHTVPDGPGWVLVRLLWLPVFALALLAYWTVFRRYDKSFTGIGVVR